MMCNQNRNTGMEPNTNAVVLIVEDNRDLADLYAQWASESHTVRTAYDGADALEQLDTSVDIVLLDRRMPGLSGDEVLGTIRERGFDCQVALVTSVELDFDSLSLGFDDYLQKPVTKQSLDVLIESLHIRTDYSEKVREHFALVSKRVALQTEKGANELATRPEVDELDDRIAELGRDVDGLLDDFSEADFRAMFETLSADDDFGATFHGHS